MLATRFDGADVVPLMTADEARECIKRINAGLDQVRCDLLDLYERRGWSSLGYASWRECVVSEFEHKQAHLYRLLTAAEIERRISPTGEIGAIPERQLRPLSNLTPIEQPAAWQRAQEIAEESRERLAARHVEQAVQEAAPRIVRIQPTLENEILIGDGEDDPWDPPMEPSQVADLPPSRINAGMYSSATSEWYTPRHIIDRVKTVFGQIDLDPCSNSNDPDEAAVPAASYWTKDDDGLAQQWHGRVYMNPPYGDEIAAWVSRLINAYESSEIAEGIALLPARTDTAWFQGLADYRICFVRGRLRFSQSDNSAPFPSVVVYLGPDAALFWDSFHDLGFIK